MRSRTSTWFECKIRYDKTMEDGMQKKVTETLHGRGFEFYRSREPDN